MANKPKDREKLNAYQRAYRKKHADKIKKWEKAWRKKNQVRRNKERKEKGWDKKDYQQNGRNRRFTTRYGISEKTYDAMYDLQQGRCNICGEFRERAGTVEVKDNIKVLCIDHNHKTNKVRKLLCWNCNALLGQAKDNPQILKSAAAYIEAND